MRKAKRARIPPAHNPRCEEKDCLVSFREKTSSIALLIQPTSEADFFFFIDYEMLN